MRKVHDFNKNKKINQKNFSQFSENPSLRDLETNIFFFLALRDLWNCSLFCLIPCTYHEGTMNHAKTDNICANGSEPEEWLYEMFGII